MCLNMDFIYRSKQLNVLKKFNLILENLTKNKDNQDLDYAIVSWCIELSINTYFPQASKEIVGNINQWLQDSKVIKIALLSYQIILIITDKRLTKGLVGISGLINNISQKKFCHNIRDSKKEMPIKSILLIAFVLTGVGFLLFLLNKKEPNKNSENANQSKAYLADQPPVREKYILALLINSDRDQELIFSLKKNNYLKPEHSCKLYGATQGLWIGTESTFNQSKIKKEFNNYSSDTTKSEYDVHFIKIELDGNDSRFNPNVNQMDRRDAFIELAKRSPKILVSSRLSCKAYEHTEFYSR